LPTTFACWNSLVPCRAAEEDLGDEVEQNDEWVVFDMSANGNGRALEEDAENWECEEDSDEPSWFRKVSYNPFKKCKRKTHQKEFFDDVPADGLRTTSADLFLFYSQTFSDNEEAIKSVDEIMDEFFSPGGWSRCFDNIYAIEANIPKELDLYIPSAQEELYNWVNGPNRQFEAAFRIIQSGEWGNYDGFYLMEGDSVPVKNYWLDVILGEIDAYKPFAVLGAQYDGDKWDAFYEQIPISLLHHTNGNGIYNTSHPLLERLVGQLEVEAPCPYNSIPYDYRMSQMWVEGTLGIVPKLAPKIMLNEEGDNITLSDNRKMFSKWAQKWQDEDPYRFTKAIHNYAATNLIPRHLGPEYIIHGAKLYSPWDPSRTEITLVISEWFFDRSLNLIKSLDSKDHPFSKVIIMVPSSASNSHDYRKYTRVPVTIQYRDAPDFMDLCSPQVSTDWFMITNAYHVVANHVDLMFTPGKFVPVIPFTPATYPFCLKYPYCNEIVRLSQRWNKGHKQVVLDMDMLYNTKERGAFCAEWKTRNGENGEDLYAKYEPVRYEHRGDTIIGPKGPTGTDYLAYLIREKKDSIYKMTDRSLYGARNPFVKVHRKEEKLDGMSEEELARRLGWSLMSNVTECSCDRFETEEDCLGSGLGCEWRQLFESCHPPEMIDDGVPICSTTDAPTMSPTLSIDEYLKETEAPTIEPMQEGLDGNDPDTNYHSEDDIIDENAGGDISEVQFVERNAAVLDVDSSSILTRMFKSREHVFDKGDVDDTNESTGNRLLLAVSSDVIFAQSDDISYGGNSSQGHSTTESLFREHSMASPNELFSIGFSERPQLFDEQDVETSCPTWGPSIVPRVFSPSHAPNSHTGMSADITRTYRNLPGRSRLFRHHFIQLEPNIDTDRLFIELLPQEDVKDRRINIDYDDEVEALRIHFVTTSMSSLLYDIGHNFAAMEQYHRTSERITTYLNDVFPSVVKIWEDALKISPARSNLVPHVKTCGITNIPDEHLIEGVHEADLVIYVELAQSAFCSKDPRPQLTICHFDQNMRPLFGSLSLCLEDMDVHDGKVQKNEVSRHVASISQLVGRFLGLSPSLFKYFLNPESGQLWGERSVLLSCGDDITVRKEVKLSNIIQERVRSNGEIIYEISTPKVNQIVRNHFDCQDLTGARLSPPAQNPMNSSECSFLNLDLRFHFDEDMTSISQNSDSSLSVTPLSLAILEDSSWYKADFSAAITPTFGRGSGCGFVDGECISGGNIPDYSEGFFCNSLDDSPGYRSGCDYMHTHKAGCDLRSNLNLHPKFQHFLPENSNFGSPFEDMEHCPLRAKNLISCSSKTHWIHHSSLRGESFDENSRCYETDSEVPVCLETVCNADDKSLGVVVQGKMFRCSYYGQEINIGLGYSIFCPRIAVVCPQFICPSNCSGKGVCEYCSEVPECICDNPFDQSPGCWES